MADVLQRLTSGHPASPLTELLPDNWHHPEPCGNENELPPMSREERVPAERLIASRMLTGKVRIAAPPDGSTVAIHKDSHFLGSNLSK